ncbi:hypothetical protein CR513_47219, partial [Mucuna pruriens]
MFRKVEINIPLLESIKQIPKYAKFLKELCVHKRKKINRGMESGGIMLALTRNDDIITGAQQALPKKSVVQPLGILEDVVVQVNELIFLVDFYVLDMEDDTFRKGSTLILGRPFLMIAKTKIDVHVGTLSMEFGDNLMQFNIFEGMKHPTEDHSLFGIYLIDELVEEHLQLDTDNDDISNFVGDTNIFDCLGSITDKANCDESWEVHNLSDSKDDITNLADLNHEIELLDLLDQVCKYEDPECSNNAEI